MTGSRYGSHRKTEVLALVFLFVAPLAFAAPCRTPPNGKPAETNVIFVQFKGCDPKPPLNIMVGSEPLDVSKIKHPELGDVWRGTTSESFPITQPPMLTIDLATLANVRTACKAVPKDYDASPGCVMVYQFRCESLWVLNIQASKKPPATIVYKRQPGKNTVEACADTLPLMPEGPGEVELTTSEGVEMRFRVQKKQFILVPLSLSSFGARRTTLTLNDLRPKCVEQSSSENTDACIALMKAQIKGVVDTLLLTKNLTP